MQVLVTGGAGYIGSIVTEALLRGGHTVIVYDNFSKGHRDAVVPPATLVEADLLDPRALREVLEGYRIEAVVHMAADSLVGESMQDPSKYYRSNLQAGLSLFDMMKLAASAAGVLVHRGGLRRAAETADRGRRSCPADEPLRRYETRVRTGAPLVRPRAWITIRQPPVFQCRRRDDD